MCRHFNIEDGRNYTTFQHSMLHYFKKGKNATETQKKNICAPYGEGAVTDQMCQKWFVKFGAGDFSLDDASRLGREVVGNQIETLIENNQHYTTQEIANILKISKSMKLLVKMKKYAFFLWKKTYGLFGQPNTSCTSSK